MIKNFLIRKIVSTIDIFSKWTFRLLRSNISESFACADIFCVKKNAIRTVMSSNNLLVANIDSIGEIYYKECKPHIGFKDYIMNAIVDFSIVNGMSTKEAPINMLIHDLYKNPSNLIKLKSVIEYATWGIDKYDGWNISIIGLPSLYRSYNKKDAKTVKFMDDKFPLFLRYIKNEVISYVSHEYLRSGDYQTFRANVSIATYKLAKLLGIEHMIPRIKFAILKIEDYPSKFGTYTNKIEGISPLHLSEKEKINISPEFQRQLNIMCMFDVLCFQRDHKQENYFIRKVNGKVNDVIAFDNDSPMTFFPFPSIEWEMCVKCSAYFKNGVINRPYIDKAFAERILGISDEDIDLNSAAF